MMLDDEIRIYLPKYLSAEDYNVLIKELENFPDNIDNRMYTIIGNDTLICQGDVLNKMPYAEIDNLDRGIIEKECIVLSNTCDINLENQRLFKSRIMYAPLVELSKYREALLKHSGKTEQQIDNHIESIKKQHISQILYLPECKSFKESIVFLDKVLNIDSRKIDRLQLKDQRLISLSDYGFYLLLFKISVHFCRLQEKVKRGSNYGAESN